MTTFQVAPNQNAYQAEFYQRNIDGTKEAYGVANLETTPFEAETDAEAGQLREDAETTASIRIVDPAVISPAVRQLEQYRGYYQFQQNLDVDRYEIEGKMQDTVVSVRDLDMEGVDVSNWNNRAAVYTHGYGLVVAAGNQRTPDGEPVFLERGIPSAGFLTEQEKFEPRVYFGENSPEYSIVGSPDGTDPVEIDYPRGKDGSTETKTTFEGDGGPQIGNTFTKLLYALKFQSEQILFSNLVNEESQILYDRDPTTRVQKVAPYLELDSDPYPSVVDGRVVWIVDGYTTSSTYPYSTNVSLSEAIADSNIPSPTLAIDEINYIRNSVKATVDAYDGSVTLYAWDDKDPVLQTWQNIYPSTLKPVSDMSADLMSHVRYPTDLFKVQRDILGIYHIDTAGSFAQQDNRWQTPNDPRSDAVLQPPYYLTMQMPGQDSPRFSMFSTFIPSATGSGGNRDVLMGYLAVDSDAGSEAGVKAEGYGQLRMLEIDTDTTVPGPGQVQNTYNSDTSVVPQLNLLQQGESEVLYGNLLTLPVGGGLLYVQPVYVQSSEGTKLPRLQKVLVAFGDKVAFEDTLTAALDTLFGGDAGAAGGDDQVEPTEPDPDTGEVPTEPTVPTDVEAEALAAAQQALTDREAALKEGDLTKFAEADKRLTDAVNTLLGLEQGAGSNPPQRRMPPSRGAASVVSGQITRPPKTLLQKGARSVRVVAAGDGAGAAQLDDQLAVPQDLTAHRRVRVVVRSGDGDLRRIPGRRVLLPAAGGPLLVVRLRVIGEGDREGGAARGAHLDLVEAVAGEDADGHHDDQNEIDDECDCGDDEGRRSCAGHRRADASNAQQDSGDRQKRGGCCDREQGRDRQEEHDQCGGEQQRHGTDPDADGCAPR